MSKQSLLFLLLGLSVILVLSGCTVRTYPLTRDRIDQDLSSGNRGYVCGTPPTAEEWERAATRTTRVFEIELGRPVKVGAKKTPESTSGGIECAPETSSFETPMLEETPSGTFEEYKVQKNDTLQKISQKYFGTSKKWHKIYKANEDVLKGPNKIYPGQTIRIPTEGMMETPENLK